MIRHCVHETIGQLAMAGLPTAIITYLGRQHRFASIPAKHCRVARLYVALLNAMRSPRKNLVARPNTCTLSFLFRHTRMRSSAASLSLQFPKSDAAASSRRQLYRWRPQMTQYHHTNDLSVLGVQQKAPGEAMTIQDRASPEALAILALQLP